MHRKVQVFSMPGKVSIGQDRNKKDPHRGRKHTTTFLLEVDMICNIEIKKIPIGDGNTNGIVLSVKKIHIEIKKIPIGDGNSRMPYPQHVKLPIEIKKIPIGDGN